ncbi:hypothetical protein [Gordonia alkanivorans]|uniref:hypothetical protein n=1 Tax=Gordonia alkanivorans TaxID=84096 RepID=UPI0024B6E311|nr:hypothetical protein [Gordonia alkanivorans]MDJ0010114.1 hypothetical protein [Gordonia alkanivorans]MDJ0495696.1 hypothetical protein [Gordonia alkanivorans]
MSDPTTPAPETARDYTQHVDRRDHRLRGTNHAGQIETRCVCGSTFDVGWERFRTPAFQAHPYCHPCTTKETP